MAKQSSVYICQQCGFQSSSFLGRCPQCDAWSSFVEQVSEDSKSKAQDSKKVRTGTIINLKDVEKKHYDRLSTGINEFDRVLGGLASPDGSQGGGIVKGSVVLVSGDPGIGKSTLLTQLALNIGQKLDVRSLKLEDLASNIQHLSSNVLYVAGEESAQQIKLRADRIVQNANLDILNEVDVDVIIAVIRQVKPTLVVVDSIQTIQTEDLSGVAGSVGQVRECAHRLQRIAKELHVPIFIVGHVTKEGTVAGPKTLEHLVDVVLNLEGDSGSQFRILRGIKNRFGATDEVGIFDMNDSGMIEVTNPSKLFLETKQNAPGSAVVALMTGIRPLLVEIQALVTQTNLPIPRRTGAGIDNNRLQLLVAVLQKRLGVKLFDQDIFVNVTGGLKISEPAADLGICLAIISSVKDKTLAPKTICIGEVGLLGELRTTRSIDKRIAEAKKLGYTNVISSENTRSLIDATKKAF